MFNHCGILKGENPYVVNFITFSGHGITFDEDAIAVIAENVEE